MALGFVRRELVEVVQPSRRTANDSPRTCTAASGALVAAILCIAFACAGCQHGGYTAQSLPPQYAATPVLDTSQIDVGRLQGPAISSNVVYPGDVLDVVLAPSIDSVADDSILKVRVNENGTAVLPLIGPVNVAGRTLPESENVIRLASIQGGYYRNPGVAVQVGSRRFHRVTVAGAVNRPGTYEIPAVASNLRTALLAAGGLADHANAVIDFSSNPLPGVRTAGHSATGMARIDLVAATAAAVQSPFLADGATVFVHRKPERFVQTMGLIGNRTIALPPNHDLRLLDVLAQAGGPQYSNWVADRVSIIRRVPGTDETVVIKASIRRAKRDTVENVLLASGDIISVDENPATFTIGTLGRVFGVGISAAQLSTIVP